MSDRRKDLPENKKDHSAAEGAGAVVGGVTGGAAAGAAVGGMTGPVGAAVGAAVGAVVGAVAGKGIAKAADPAVEDAYWRDNYSAARTSLGAPSMTITRPHTAMAWTRIPGIRIARSTKSSRSWAAIGAVLAASLRWSGNTPSTPRATPGSV